ncbi:hypothetical protein K7X08_012316 [Anisodus acutangulus]|uniref:Uncharacterized protein n=1 Tax=Anisodus acutangulus TaxID=402998 RepID=A0A9Q1LA23_9SOLA|nr:hypothetical protein K7X08_012316 [Anisodus acutangulus]
MAQEAKTRGLNLKRKNGLKGKQTASGIISPVQAVTKSMTKETPIRVKEEAESRQKRRRQHNPPDVEQTVVIPAEITQATPATGHQQSLVKEKGNGTNGTETQNRKGRKRIIIGEKL